MNKEELTKHVRRVVMRSAHLAAVDRGDRPLLSISPHVSIGSAPWTVGNDDADFHFENSHAESSADAKEEALGEDGSRVTSLENGTMIERSV